MIDLFKRPALHLALKLLSVFCLAVLVSACSDKTPTYRYRLTVEVETPDGLKTGSSVIEVRQRLGYAGSSPGNLAVERRARGQAVAVDLPGGRTLFALLQSEDNIDWASNVMLRVAPNYQYEAFEDKFDNMLLLKGAVELPRTWPRLGRDFRMSGYPMLVTFGDIRDLTSVERVDPDDLAASFGEGVSLKRITVEMTDDPVTTGIEKRLGWLGKPFDPNVTNDDFPEDFPVGEFYGLFQKK